MAFWLRKLPTEPGLYEQRNYDSAFPTPAREMFVGYVNWAQDPKLGHGTKPSDYGRRILRAVLVEHPMTTDSLTVEEWGGEWKRLTPPAKS